MTAVLAISFPYHVLVIADCRVTWRAASRRLQDNLQKLYHFSPTGIVAFAGSVAAAQALFRHIASQPTGQPLPPDPTYIAHEISSWARAAYRSLPSADQVEFELLYAAADYSRVGLAGDNLVFADNVLVTMSAPDFQLYFQSDAAALGYGKSLEIADLVSTRDQLLSWATNRMGIAMQVGIAVGTYGERLARLSGEPVGGLYTVAVADVRGVTWYPYSYSQEVGIRVEGGKFVQFDNREVPNREFPLQAVWEFDVRRPSPSDLYVKPPDSRPERPPDA
ncbi:MAG: hypothetical protein WD906_08690 [Anaerolineales bacterium]